MIMTMQKYEEMFFSNKDELETLLIKLVGDCLDGDEKAEEELATIKEQIDYTYEIEADADFTFDWNVSEESAISFDDIDEYKKFKALEDDHCLTVGDLDKWVEFEVCEFGELCVNDTKITIKFDGMSDTASIAAKEAMEKIYQKDRREFIFRETEARMKAAKEQVERLQAQIISDEQKLQAIKDGNVCPALADALGLHK